jgi:putative membrane protein insertion efficiency factor
MTAAPLGTTATTSHVHDHRDVLADAGAPVQPTTPSGARPARGLRRAAISLVKAYQGAASGRVSPCRFYPSCSNYAVEAFEVHGFWRATALTARRLLRCRPFGPHGVDLVPLPVDGHRRERNP